VSYLKGKAKIIAVNDNWRMAPWAEILYAADAKWWRYYGYSREFLGQRWTQHNNGSTWAEEARKVGIRVIRSANLDGVSTDPRIIHLGGNSGFQAINLAIHTGAKRILLLGFDCIAVGPKSHWFGHHPPELQRDSPYALFRDAFRKTAPQIQELGVDVINCSRMTTVDAFRKARLQDII
jgi:hypothetical protein